MIYEDRTRILRQGLFEVQNEVGLGRSEEVYHQASRAWLASHGVPHQSKPPHEIQVGGQVVHILYPDFVLWDGITIELKSLVRRLRDEDRVQIFNYLKRRADKLGLLVNLGLDRVCVERIAYDPPVCQLEEDWSAWSPAITGSFRETVASLQTVFRSLFQQHQTGYGTEIVKKLVVHGLRQNGLSFAMNPSGVSRFQGQPLGESPLACLVVDNQIVLTFTALFDDNQFNIHRTRSFMKCLGLNQGLAINFGKRIMEITALTLTP